jgi:RimJ/RimL family protein N-acetyltransferase
MHSRSFSVSTAPAQLQSFGRHPNEHALIGSLTELVTLDDAHAADLFAAGRDPAIWRWMPLEGFGSIDDVRAWIAAALDSAARGDQQPYAIVDRRRGRIVGSTRFMEIKPDEGALEVGWTWLAPDSQRTGINYEAKYLLLQHAFVEWRAVRVAFFPDEQNGRARASLVRLGATYEGTLRCHRASADPSRNSAAYSIVASEWPQVRAGIEQRTLRGNRARTPFRPSILAGRQHLSLDDL